MPEDRFQQLIDALQENPNSFAQKIGVAATVIYNIIGGRKSRPSFEVLFKIKQVFPHVNMNWLIDGNGIPLMDQGNTNNFSEQMSDLIARMYDLEKLAKLRDQHVSILESNIASLKESMELAKPKS